MADAAAADLAFDDAARPADTAGVTAAAGGTSPRRSQKERISSHSIGHALAGSHDSLLPVDGAGAPASCDGRRRMRYSTPPPLMMRTASTRSRLVRRACSACSRGAAPKPMTFDGGSSPRSRQKSETCGQSASGNFSQSSHVWSESAHSTWYWYLPLTVRTARIFSTSSSPPSSAFSSSSSSSSSSSKEKPLSGSAAYSRISIRSRMLERGSHESPSLP